MKFPLQILIMVTKFFNRYNQQIETESVCGEKFLKFLYSTRLGSLAVDALIKRKFLSVLYGKYASSSFSKSAIVPFIKKYNIKESSFAEKTESFDNFNAFFTRKLKQNTRPIALGSDAIIAPADGKYLAFENISKLDTFFVKGERLNLSKLTFNSDLSHMFASGSMLIARLAPTDYHRFHFPLDCVPQNTHLINGMYFSVNPLALKRSIQIFLENKRMTTLLTKSIIGNCLMVEVGATLIGSIHQTFRPNIAVGKGTEKGYFAFGGSTVILLFERNKVKFSEDILKNTANGLETYVLMGDLIGTAN